MLRHSFRVKGAYRFAETGQSTGAGSVTPSPHGQRASSSQPSASAAAAVATARVGLRVGVNVQPGVG
jgi:hypothetical protein